MSGTLSLDDMSPAAPSAAPVSAAATPLPAATASPPVSAPATPPPAATAAPDPTQPTAANPDNDPFSINVHYASKPPGAVPWVPKPGALPTPDGTAAALSLDDMAPSPPASAPPPEDWHTHNFSNLGANLAANPSFQQFGAGAAKATEAPEDLLNMPSHIADWAINRAMAPFGGSLPDKPFADPAPAKALWNAAGYDPASVVPQTMSDYVTQGIGGAAAFAPLAGASALGQLANLGRGATSGLGSLAGRNLAPKGYENWGEFLGGVLGGFAPDAASYVAGKAASLASRSLPVFDGQIKSQAANIVANSAEDLPTVRAAVNPATPAAAPPVTATPDMTADLSAAASMPAPAASSGRTPMGMSSEVPQPSPAYNGSKLGAQLAAAKEPLPPRAPISVQNSAIPGVQLTPAEISGDKGLAKLQSVWENRDPTFFRAQSDQNMDARAAFAQAAGTGADPAAAQAFVRNRLARLDATEAQMRAAAKTQMDNARNAVGGHMSKAEYDQGIRDRLAALKDAREQSTAINYRGLDRDNPTINGRPVQAEAQRRLAQLDSRRVAGVTKEERELYDRTKEWNDPNGLTDWERFKSLRTDVGTTIGEVGANSPAGQRLVDFKKKMDASLSPASQKAAEEARLADASDIKDDVHGIAGRESQELGAAEDAAGGSHNPVSGRSGPDARPEGAMPSGTGREVPSGGQAGSTSGRAGSEGEAGSVDGATWNDEHSRQDIVARAGVAETHRLFNSGAVGSVLQRNGQDFSLPIEGVVDRLVNRGPKAGKDIDQAIEAIKTDPSGLAFLQDAIANKVRREAFNPDGSFSATKYDKLLTASGTSKDLGLQTVLDRFPEIKPAFDKAASAQKTIDTLDEALPKIRAELSNGAAKYFLDGKRPVDVANSVLSAEEGNILLKAKEVNKLLESSPAAIEGQRQAYNDALVRKFVQEVTEGDRVRQVVSPSLVTYFNKNQAGLREALGADQFKSWQMLSQDLQRTKISSAGIKVGDNSSTAQRLGADAAYSAPHTVMEHLLLHAKNKSMGLSGAAVAGSAMAGPLGAAIGFAGTAASLVVAAARARGIEKVNDLVKAATRDPAVMHELLKQIPENPAAQLPLAHRLARALAVSGREIPSNQQQDNR